MKRYYCPECFAIGRLLPTVPERLGGMCASATCFYRGPRLDEVEKTELAAARKAEIDESRRKAAAEASREAVRKKKSSANLKRRMDVDPEIRLSEYLSEIRSQFGSRGGYKIYIAKLRDDVIDAGRFKRPKFPSAGYPPIHARDSREFKGCVYVGLTTLTFEQRFKNHKQNEKAGKGYIRDYRISDDYEVCVGELTEKYGIFRCKRQDASKLESWLGWVLYKAGYWVWGPHQHEQEDFLDESPYW